LFLPKSIFLKNDEWQDDNLISMNPTKPMFCIAFQIEVGKNKKKYIYLKLFFYVFRLTLNMIFKKIKILL